MKTFIITNIILLFSTLLFGQDSTTKFELSNTFKLIVKEYNNSGKESLSIKPDTLELDECNRFAYGLRNYHKRFEYLLFSSLSYKLNPKIWYPNIDKINSIYIDSLNADKAFVKDLEATAFYICSDDSVRQLQINELELMNIASKFFYCDKVGKDSSISWHICIGLNGIKEANWGNKYRVIEAFCYEAIFTHLNKRRLPKFVKNFKRYIAEESNEYRKSKNVNESFLYYVRTKVFEKMQNDKQLKMTLIEHYNQNKENLSFLIK